MVKTFQLKVLKSDLSRYLMLFIVSACIGPMNDTYLYSSIALHFIVCNVVAFTMHHSVMRASALLVPAITVRVYISYAV